MNPFESIDWSAVPETVHPGEAGSATWRTLDGSPRVRLVTYSPGYRADHWCSRGHVIFIVEGAMRTELADGRVFDLRTGMSYRVGNDVAPHRSSTVSGAVLFIVD